MLRNDFLPFKSVDEEPITNHTLTVFECAALSRDVYESGNPNRPALPPDWSRHIISDPYVDGYFGAVYLKFITPTKIGVVVAHRGTDLSFKGNILGDLQIACNLAPIQCLSATDFWVHKAVPDLRKHFEKQNLEIVFVVHTGHSLGAIIADVSSGGANLSVTFENPGSKHIWTKLYRSFLEQSGEVPPGKIEEMIVKALQKMAMKCSSYQADINLINTCNEQIGKCFAILPLSYDYFFNKRIPPALEEIGGCVYTSLYYLFNYTADQHRITEIYNKLKISENFQSVNYPFGFQKNL